MRELDDRWAAASVERWHWRVLTWAVEDYRRRRWIGKAASLCRALDRRLWLAGVKL